MLPYIYIYILQHTHRRQSREMDPPSPPFLPPAAPGNDAPPGYAWAVLVILSCLSGIFSGLNLGLMSLTVEDLNIVINSSNDPQQVRNAKKILPLRKRGNLLLCSLLIGNTVVNVMLSVLTDDIWVFLFGEGIAGVRGRGFDLPSSHLHTESCAHNSPPLAMSLHPFHMCARVPVTHQTVLGLVVPSLIIVIFGEIVPQSVCSRYAHMHARTFSCMHTCIFAEIVPHTPSAATHVHTYRRTDVHKYIHTYIRYALAIGAFSLPLTYFFVVAFLPVSVPIAALLDKLLGAEVSGVYTRQGLIELVKLNVESIVHAKESGLTKEDAQLLGGALTFKGGWVGGWMDGWMDAADAA